MESEIDYAKLIGGRLLEESPHLFGALLHEEQFQPDIRVDKVHTLITSPFQSLFLQIHGGKPVAIFLESTCPVQT